MLIPLLVAAALSPAVQAFVKIDEPVVAITRVRVIDGTGGPPREDQTVVISGGKIAALGPSASTAVPQDAPVLQREGGTVLPGLVGMHDHLFYPDSTSCVVPANALTDIARRR
jgi:imidazolonepropionase-like amidohydrolase